MFRESLKKIAATTATAALLCPLMPSLVQAGTGQQQPGGKVIQLGDRAPNIGSEEITVPQVLQNSPRTLQSPLQPLRVLPSKPPVDPQAVPLKKSWSPQVTAQQVSGANTPAALPKATKRVMTSKAESLIETEIKSPTYVNVNKEAEVRINVINTGDTPVNDVQFTAVLPSHTELVTTTPKASSVDGQILKFDLDRIEARDQREIIVAVRPTKRQAIDIATSVRTENTQKVLVAVREPQLSLVINGPRQANVGQNVQHEIIVSNVGDGTATDVQLNANFPEQLIELKSSLSEAIKAIEPGKSVKVTFESQAIAAGPIELKATAQSDDGSDPKTAAIDVTILEPKLQISAIGPKLNFVNRNGIYTLNLENAGKVDITDVDVALVVPVGMKVTTISREADVDASKGILRWKFENIPVGSKEQIQMMAIVTEEGPQVCNFVIDSQETSEKQIQLTTQVSTRADIAVQIKNESGPVQVGGKAIFNVELSNHGSRKAVDVNVRVDLPEGLTAVPMDSQKVVIDGNSIIYTEPQIAPGKSSTFKFTAEGRFSGEHVVRTITQMEGSQRKTMAEDSVYVYDVDEARVSESLTPTVIKR